MFNYRRYYENEKQVGKEYTFIYTKRAADITISSATTPRFVGSTYENRKPELRRKDFNETSAYTLNLQLNYNRTFGKHDIGAMFLYEQYEEWGDMFWAQRKQLLSSSLEQLFAGSADSQWKDADGHESEIGRIGYIGRVNYGFDNRYLLEANFRYDSSGKWIRANVGIFPVCFNHLARD